MGSNFRSQMLELLYSTHIAQHHSGTNAMATVEELQRLLSSAALTENLARRGGTSFPNEQLGLAAFGKD